MAEPRAHMPDAVSLRGVTAGGLAIAAGVGVSMAVAFVLVRAAGVTSAVPPPRMPPAPRLQATPAQDMATYRAEKHRQLTEYAWADRDRGIVRIPIERAMAIVAQEPSR
ncbi:MAG: hypothetical protein U1F48_08115 [Burkholderiales bacterium]